MAEMVKGMLFAIGLILTAILLVLLGALLFFPLLVVSFLPGILGVTILCTWFFVRTPGGKGAGGDGPAAP